MISWLFHFSLASATFSAAPRVPLPPEEYRCGERALIIEDTSRILVDGVTLDGEWSLDWRSGRFRPHQLEFAPNAQLTLDGVLCERLAR